MSQTKNDNIFVRAPKPIDGRTTLNTGALYATVADFLADGAVTPYRFISMTVPFIIAGEQVEYWFVGGIEDSNFQLKSVDGSGFELLSNKSTNLTSPNNTKYPTTLAVSTAIGTGSTIGADTTGNSATTTAMKVAGSSSTILATNLGSSAVRLNATDSKVVDITGNAETVTNGVYTTGSYANPSWITSLAYSKLTGAPNLSVYELLANKQNSLATDGTGVKYPTVDAVNEGLSKKQNDLRILNVDQFVTNPNATDNTAELNAAINYAVINDIREIFIPNDINILGKIDLNKKFIYFSGNGKINNSYYQNLLENSTTYLSELNFIDKVNNNYNSLTKVCNILNDNVNPLKIVVWGDSISNGVDYSFSDITDYKATSIDQYISSNKIYDQLISQLYLKFPNKNIEIYNRSIPGASIENYTDLMSTFSSIPNLYWYTPDMASKRWIDVIEEVDADLIFFTNGMNSGDNFLQSFFFAKAEVNLWTKQPEWVIMSTPTVNYTNDPTYGDFSEIPRTTKLKIGRQQQYISSYFDFYMIDVARLANIKRYGIDFKNFSYQQLDVSKYQVFDISNNPLPSKTEIIIPSVNTTYYLQRNDPSGDLQIISHYSLPTNGTLEFAISGSVIKISRTQVTIITFRGNNLDVDEFVFPVKESYTDFQFFGIEVSSKSISVFINDLLIARAKISAANPDRAFFISSKNTNGNITLFDLRVFNAVYNTYKPILTGDDIWGSNNNGNGINHPSNIGLSEVYYPAIDEFVEDMYTMSKNLDNVSSFNGRKGSVTLSSVDITAALTYTPVMSINTNLPDITGNVLLALTSLQDVNISIPLSDNYLKFDGLKWINTNLPSKNLNDVCLVGASVQSNSLSLVSPGNLPYIRNASNPNTYRGIFMEGTIATDTFVGLLPLTDDYVIQNTNGNINFRSYSNGDAIIRGNVSSNPAPTTGDHLTNKTYVDGLISGIGSNYVNTTGNQTGIAGDKSFTGYILANGGFYTGSAGSDQAYIVPSTVYVGNTTTGNTVQLQNGGIDFGNGSFGVNLSPTTLTATRNILLPNAAGTLALISDIAAYADALNTTNMTATPFTKATLNSTYPSAPIRFTVSCPTVGSVYTKYDATNWYETTVTFLP